MPKIKYDEIKRKVKIQWVDDNDKEKYPKLIIEFIANGRYLSFSDGHIIPQTINRTYRPNPILASEDNIVSVDIPREFPMGKILINLFDRNENLIQSEKINVCKKVIKCCQKKELINDTIYCITIVSNYYLENNWIWLEFDRSLYGELYKGLKFHLTPMKNHNNVYETKFFCKKESPIKVYFDESIEQFIIWER